MIGLFVIVSLACGLILGIGLGCTWRKFEAGEVYDRGHNDGYGGGFSDGQENGYALSRTEWADKVMSVNLERDRLRNELTLYDLCECKARWYEHVDGTAQAFGRCSGFRLLKPADPLETAIATHDGSGVIDYETLTARAMRKERKKEEEDDREDFAGQPYTFPRYVCRHINDYEPGYCVKCQKPLRRVTTVPMTDDYDKWFPIVEPRNTDTQLSE